MSTLDSGLGGLTRRAAEPPRWEFRDLAIRRYAPADHAAVLTLHREALAGVGLVPGDGVYYEHDFARMEEIYFAAGGEFLVGERGGEVVAMGGLRRAELVPCGASRARGGWARTGAVAEPGGSLTLAEAHTLNPARHPPRHSPSTSPSTDASLTTAELVRLRVRPDLQRRGYGAAMEEALETRAAELGYRRLVCDTTELQGPAIALYRRFGWTETRREVIGGIVNIYFAKDLRSPRGP